MMALFLDVTARKTAEAELWEGQHRKNFVLALGDRMRELQQQAAIEQLACESLGQHLALGLVAVVDWPGGDSGPQVSSCWQAQGNGGGEDLDADLLGRIRETLSEARTIFLEPLLGRANGDILPSAIVVPTARWGRPDGALVVRPAAGSRLKRGDVACIEEVAERLCGAVERSQYARMLEQRVEHAIAERDRIWRLSPELLAVVDAKGRYASVNPAVRAILGWTQEQFLAMDCVSRSIRTTTKPPARPWRRPAAPTARRACGTWRTASSSAMAAMPGSPGACRGRRTACTWPGATTPT